MAIIFHITTETEWSKAIEKGFYENASLNDEGFIHCCLEEQVAGVLQRFFAEKENLLRLEIETHELANPFYYEWSPSIGDTFPHIYGLINLDAVKSVQPIR